jgi:hypothetical protein
MMRIIKLKMELKLHFIHIKINRDLKIKDYIGFTISRDIKINGTCSLPKSVCKFLIFLKDTSEVEVTPNTDFINS